MLAGRYTFDVRRVKGSGLVRLALEHLRGLSRGQRVERRSRVSLVLGVGELDPHSAIGVRLTRLASNPRVAMTGARRARVRRVALLVLLLAVPACLKKAMWMPNDRGGFTLITHAGSVEQALVRFERRAKQLCHGRAYQMTTPEVVDRGFNAGPLGAGTTVTLQTFLTCQ